MADRVGIRALIHGRVQGVWYRGWTEDQARARGLTGWVRNLPDGSVEALFIGSRAIVDDMLTACRTGPPAAAVSRIDTEEVADPPDLGGFELRR